MKTYWNSLSDRQKKAVIGAAVFIGLVLIGMAVT